MKKKKKMMKSSIKVNLFNFPDVHRVSNQMNHLDCRCKLITVQAITDLIPSLCFMFPIICRAYLWFSSFHCKDKIDLNEMITGSYNTNRRGNFISFQVKYSGIPIR